MIYNKLLSIKKDKNIILYNMYIDSSRIDYLADRLNVLFGKKENVITTCTFDGLTPISYGRFDKLGDLCSFKDLGVYDTKKERLSENYKSSFAYLSREWDFLSDEEKKEAGLLKGVHEAKVKLDEAIKDLEMDKDLADRYVNESFSGGEKKKNEILQMKMLEPKISILDEIDSGLDVDAVRIVSENINNLKEKNNMGLIVISHYHRLYEYIKPSKVVVLINGTIVKTGDSTLLDFIDKNGFDSIKREAGMEDEITLLETCAFKVNKND